MKMIVDSEFFPFFFLLVELGIAVRASCLLGRHFTT